MPVRRTVAGLLATTVLILAGCRSVPPPLHFRFEIGPEPIRTIAGYIEGTDGRGAGYSVAVTDLDGDGVPETRQSGVLTICFRPGVEESSPVPEVTFTHHGLEWTLEFACSADRLPADPGERVETTVEWSAHQPDQEWEVWFSDAALVLYRSSRAAAAAQPTRLGPPFSWSFSGGTRGPSAVVTARLTDASGANLAGYWKSDDQVAPRILVRGAGGAVETIGEYG